ncbi:MAG: hypothetical protein QOI95_244 [Acidimicrobiaceae bacterium]|jgi:lipopolysaccharide biosynthesis protein
MTDARAIAFYLPQFHPVPQNDAWWGSGFTEWTNVARATPRFDGHYQPHLPSELGYYDLRVPEVRERQAQLARTHGIEGFCYYHYWFRGQRVIDRVYTEVLRSGRPDFPFCLMWANESWTRVWDGGNHEVLVAQEYDRSDDDEHIRALIEAFADPRYIRVDGRPLFMIYRAQSLPDPKRTTDAWRKACVESGLPEPLLVKCDTYSDEVGPDAFGCDMAAQFLPHGVTERVPSRSVGHDFVFDYDAIVDTFLDQPATSWRQLSTVFPGWDNSPRRADHPATIVENNTPEKYERWLRGTIARDEQQGLEPIVFINAWNEWAEGAHLEPDARFGRGFLEATARVLLGHVPAVDAARPTFDPPQDDTVAYADLYHRLYDEFVKLQRFTTELLGTVELRVRQGLAEHDALLRQSRHESAELAAHLRRLQEELDSWRGTAQ